MMSGELRETSALMSYSLIEARWTFHWLPTALHFLYHKPGDRMIEGTIFPFRWTATISNAHRQVSFELSCLAVTADEALRLLYRTIGLIIAPGLAIRISFAVY